jgi:hypothetical protein
MGLLYWCLYYLHLHHGSDIPAPLPRRRGAYDVPDISLLRDRLPGADELIDRPRTGLLIGTVFLAELVPAAGHRRRPPVTRGGRFTREESRVVLVSRSGDA